MSRRGCHIATLALACWVWVRLVAATESCQLERTTTAVKMPVQVEMCVDKDRYMASLIFKDEDDNYLAILDIGEKDEDIWMTWRKCAKCPDQKLSRGVMQNSCMNLKILKDEEGLHLLSHSDDLLYNLPVLHRAVRVKVQKPSYYRTCSFKPKHATVKSFLTTTLQENYTTATLDPGHEEEDQEMVVLLTEAALVGVVLVLSVVVLVLILTLRM